MSIVPAPMCDMAEVDTTMAQGFLDRLDSLDQFTFQVFDDKKGGRVKPQIFHGSFEQHSQVLTQLNTLETAGIFVTINATDLKGRRIANITKVRAYFVDLDDPRKTSLQSIIDGPLEPQLVVQSSERDKGHAYWLVEDAPLETFSTVQTHLARRFHCDPKVKDLGRVMRLPGFLHHKKFPTRTTIIHDSCVGPYSYQEIIEAFGICLASSEVLQGLRERGLYIEPIPDRPGGHRILCPWRDQHTTGDRGSVYFEANTNGYSKEAYFCHHAHCKRKGIRDLREALSLELTASTKIYIKGGNLPQALDEAESALRDSNAGIYQRDGMLVRMIPKYLNDQVVIEPVQHHYLVEVLTREVEWYRFDGRGNEGSRWKRSDCPEKHAKSLLSRGIWNFPHLQGIINAPTLRADGSILEAKGYDKSTGLCFQSRLDFPPMPSKPTIDDAVEALGSLKQLLSGFPFVDGASLSVALSAILTALIRRSLPTAPLHAFNAPKRGAGKSLLADVVGMIATGSKPTQVSQPDNQSEERKRLLALLMAGDPVVCIDNVERPVKSDALCTILTSETWSERLLGLNRNVDVSTGVLFLATGNNIIFEGDLTRRVLKCTIDPRCERPEERRFDVNLYSYVLEHRAQLVIAALTILHAYNCAGRPSQVLSPLGSFGEWSDRVRSALVWCGLDDPCRTQRSIEAEDPVSVSLRRLLTVWRSEFRGPVLAREVLRRANEGHVELCDAIEAFVGDPAQIGTRKLGACLQKYQNRSEGGLRFVQKGTIQRAVQWQVEVAAGRADGK